MKKLFSKAAGFLKTLALAIWEADDTHIDVPTKQDWKFLVNFKDSHSHSLKEHFLAFGAVHIVSLSLCVRFAVTAVFALSAWVAIFFLTLWKLATSWSKSK